MSQIDQTLIQFCSEIKRNIADYRSVFPFAGHAIALTRLLASSSIVSFFSANVSLSLPCSFS